MAVMILMIGKGVDTGTPVSADEAKRILEERKKRGELIYEQQLAYDHASKVIKELDKAVEKKLEKALEELGVSQRASVKVVELLPANAMTLRQVLAKENRTFTDEEITKILTLVKEVS